MADAAITRLPATIAMHAARIIRFGRGGFAPPSPVTTRQHSPLRLIKLKRVDQSFPVTCLRAATARQSPPTQAEEVGHRARVRHRIRAHSFVWRHHGARMRASALRTSLAVMGDSHTLRSAKLKAGKVSGSTPKRRGSRIAASSRLQPLFVKAVIARTCAKTRPGRHERRATRRRRASGMAATRRAARPSWLTELIRGTNPSWRGTLKPGGGARRSRRPSPGKRQAAFTP